MAYMNNRAGKQTRATFQVAGGCIVKFRHPYLAGAIDSGFGGIDEIDVSASLKLSDTFFNAVPNQRSAYQQVLIDGSVVTITNHLSNGTITLPVIPTTGLVATGDFLQGRCGRHTDPFRVHRRKSHHHILLRCGSCIRT